MKTKYEVYNYTTDEYADLVATFHDEAEVQNFIEFFQPSYVMKNNVLYWKNDELEDNELEN